MHTRRFLPQFKCARPGIARLGLTLAAGVLLCQCKSVPKSEVVVSVKDQRMGVYHEGVLQRQYAISTSKFGIGDQPNSYRTPLGRHEIIAKFGHKLPTGAVMKSRQWNGEVLKPNAPGRDPIVSRILWLRGLESSNRNAMKRYIYIHGTPEESRLGQPASYGCIRMGMQDVVEVFNDINIGAKVVITKEHLPHGNKPAKVKDQPEAVPTVPVTPPATVPGAAVPAQQLAATTPAPLPAGKAGKTGAVAEAPALAAVAPAPVAEQPVAPEPKQSKSFFSFLSRNKKDPQDDIPLEVTDAARRTAPPAKKQAEGNQQHLIGPAVPEPIAKGKKKDRVENVTSSDNAFARLLGFHSGN